MMRKDSFNMRRSALKDSSNPRDESLKEAESSTCLRLKVGAVIISQNGDIISVGHNRNPDDSICETCPRIERNAPHGEDYSDCNAIHAEQDAIENALAAGYVFDGTEGIVISHSACPNCIELLSKYNIEILDI